MNPEFISGLSGKFNHLFLKLLFIENCYLLKNKTKKKDCLSKLNQKR